MNLLNEASDSRFVTKKWNIVNDQSNANYDVRNEIIYNAEVLKSNNYDYNDAYILVRGNITIIGHAVIQGAFKTCAPFTNCITKIDGITVDLDLIMPMYNLLEYSSNYSDTTGSLWFYSKVESTTFNADIAYNDNFKSFDHKTKLLKETFADGLNGILKYATISVPLNYLSNFGDHLKFH